MIGSRALRRACRFLPDGRLKTTYQARLDMVSPYDRNTDLPKDETAQAIARASKVDRQTGLPRTP